MATATRPVDAKALRLERDNRFDAGETIAAIDADFRARGIDPRTLRAVGRPRTGEDTPAATGRHPDAEPATAGRTLLSGRTIDREILAERLRGAVTRGRRVMEPGGEIGMAHDNHKDFYRFERIVERIACETYGDHLRPSEVEEVDEIAARLWDQMGTAILEWAQGLDSRGTAR